MENYFKELTPVDVVGWIGSICILLAYGLNSYQRIRSDSWLFLLLNLGGGICLIFYTAFKEAFANTFLNIVWVIIALPAIARAWSKRKSAQP